MGAQLRRDSLGRRVFETVSAFLSRTSLELHPDESAEPGQASDDLFAT